ncbi:MAG TPA: hypothetical protein QGE93_00550 [Acidobacteriota bacterium]|jgi:hypothetical protein|nr:hypothetical protein [Acidobacteriota bacterium]MBO08043.1 hypothetical protein [Acidobacteriota bacterium]HJN47210.1 hypothetical protein [Acidobacteriota bacterium]|tara:strand:+ start:1368 stop:1676 length:309 start_codon:yes stop_codon:yes gene_type:complete
MFELMVLIALIFGLGLAILAAWIVLLSIYVLFRLLGFAVKASFAGIFLLPLVLLTGAIFFLNLVIIGMPLLIAFVLFRSLVGHFRRDEPDTFIVQTLPPDSS